MRLSIKETARALKVSEEKIRHWIKEAHLPVHKVKEQYRVNKTDLLEWLTSQKKEIQSNFLSQPDELGISLAKPIERGGIHSHVKGKDKGEVLKTMIEGLSLPDSVDRTNLFEMLHSRDLLGYTETFEGIALPHVRNPIVLPIQKTQIALFYFEELIDFGSKEGKMIHSRFLILSTTVREHLAYLARLSCMLSHLSFRSLISCKAKKEEILLEMRRLEKELKKSV